ncbi:hypothetical protein HPP92_009737 [Vanilla planifolia]|uniref:Cytochrome P450 71A1 n=1 Tax=Vanilla planifolia TaxID=51239 RepID=A0A835V6W2_VANPL|nr:hypothetical protein HPP92_009737 [Vanilla planifolia]
MSPFSYLQTALLLLLLLPIISILIRLRAKKGKPKVPKLKLPPGPSPLPIIGNLHHLGRQPHISLRRLSQRHGPIIHLTLGQIPTVVVSSPRTARDVLRTHDLALCSRPALFAARKVFYDCTDIAFAPYGSYWRGLRKLCILELLSARRVDSFASARAAETTALVASIVNQQRRHGSVNLSLALGAYASGVICRAAFGKDWAGAGGHERRGFQQMLDEHHILLGGFSVIDFFPSLEWVNALTGKRRQLQGTFSKLSAFLDEVLADHLEKRESKVLDLVDVLLDAQRDESAEVRLTMDNIKAVILDMFAAGTDTTFTTLDWAMTELAMNPNAMRAAQQEVRAVVGNRTSVAESDLAQLPYMKALIKETFRLHPPAPLLLPRESMEAVTIEGYDIPAKTRIFVNAWAIGRDPEYWEEAEAFVPERFLGSEVDYKGQDFELLPFGAGRRGCPGLAFGVVGVEIALARMLHSFDWELPPGTRADDLDLKEDFALTMHRAQNLVLVARPLFV